MRTYLFIDGFNLYHSMMNDRNYRGFRWLSFRAFGESLISSRSTLTGIYFFTAFYPGDPAKRLRHETYIEALKSVGVTTVLGKFKTKFKYCKSCGQDVRGWEEKETDVNIAVAMFEHALLDNFDQLLIVSADSDILPAIVTLKRLYPHKIIKVILPPNARSGKALKAAADGSIQLNAGHFVTNLLPQQVVYNGKVINKPVSW